MYRIRLFGRARKLNLWSSSSSLGNSLQIDLYSFAMASSSHNTSTVSPMSAMWSRAAIFSGDASPSETYKSGKCAGVKMRTLYALVIQGRVGTEKADT